MPLDIALINGNTSDRVTARMVREAEALDLPAARFRGLTATFGAPYVTDRAAFAVAGHAVVAMAQEMATAPPDAAIIACFGDPGLQAAREILPCPVVGMAEAALHTACQMAPRVGIVTGGAAWGPMLHELAAAAGMATRIAAIETLALDGGQIAADPDAALPHIARGIETLAAAGAGVVILGGAALTGLAPALRARTAVPLVDGLVCAVAQAVALATVARA